MAIGQRMAKIQNQILLFLLSWGLIPASYRIPLAMAMANMMLTAKVIAPIM